MRYGQLQSYSGGVCLRVFDYAERKRMEGTRINKYLSEAGFCSRREADRLIAGGAVTIDGRVATLGDQVMPGQKVLCNSQPVSPEEEKILLAFHKPRGIVCTTQKAEKNNVVDYIHYGKRVYPVGRLDKESEGLLLLTNQGDIVNKMMRSVNRHEKEYIVTVNKPVTADFVRGMSGGVYLEELEATTRKCAVEKLQAKQFRIVLTQGLNRQIRRMCEVFGYRVERLVRVRIMNIRLGDLPAGQYRQVTDGEYRELMKMIEHSADAPSVRKI